MFAAAALAAFAFVVVLASPEPKEEDVTKGSFQWSDVRAVVATREWRYIVGSYWVMGIFIGESRGNAAKNYHN